MEQDPNDRHESQPEPEASAPEEATAVAPASPAEPAAGTHFAADWSRPHEPAAAAVETSVEPPLPVPEERVRIPEAPQPATEPVPAAARTEPVEAEERGGPNWMLVFVCVWAGVTALWEAWTMMGPAGLQAFRNLGTLGYALMGAGLLGFAVEAFRWSRRRGGAGEVLLIVLPALLTLAGMACLIGSSDVGRRI